MAKKAPRSPITQPLIPIEPIDPAEARKRSFVKKFNARMDERGNCAESLCDALWEKAIVSNNAEFMRLALAITGVHSPASSVSVNGNGNTVNVNPRIMSDHRRNVALLIHSEGPQTALSIAQELCLTQAEVFPLLCHYGFEAHPDDTITLTPAGRNDLLPGDAK